MNFSRYCQQAVVNLGAAKLRSFLAVLGILVGTAAVVALMSCGQLATEKALSQFKSLGIDLLSVTVFKQERDNAHAGNEKMSIEQWRQIKQLTPYVKVIAPYATAYQHMSYKGKEIKGPIIGADENLMKIIQIKLAEGHFVSFVDNFEHYCVIGHHVAEAFKEVSLEDPLGKQLRIGKSLYTVIGVMAPWRENGFFNEDINQSVIIPVAGMALIVKEDEVNNAIMLLSSDSPIDELIEQIKQYIQLQAPKLSIFTRSAKQIIASMESQGRIFTLLLAVIGGISLLVGGIGIMNIMLVSVSERKQEIGIRKAVGAKNSQIQMLFLVESMMLSLLGGGLGVILGICFTYVMAYFSDWPFMLYATPPLAGFLVSVLTGIFFGYYPARRAAMLEPIVSLRNGV